jgi:hypothetical protein
LQRLLPFAGFDGAEIFLRVVGTIDVLVGLQFLRREAPAWAYAWAIGWGFATAASRLYFLGALDGDPWVNGVRPVAEALARVGNWALALALWRRRPAFWMGVVVNCGLAALALHYLAEAYGPYYPREVLRKPEPLWLFHAIGILALAGLAVRAFRPTRLVLAAPVAAALFELFVLDAPHGLIFALLRAGEHAPYFFCLASVGAAFARTAERPFISALSSP